jgi:hypothetical protein
MQKTAGIILSILLLAVWASPVLAAGHQTKKSIKSTAANVAGTVYQGGVSLAERTEGLVSGCLKTTFSFFNPCLDVVKGCSTIVMSPIEKPLDYLESKVYTAKPVKAVAPKK